MVKKAHSFELRTCDDPECGPHFVATDCDGDTICEIIIARCHTLSLIQALQGLLYSKVVEEEGD